MVAERSQIYADNLYLPARWLVLIGLSLLIGWGNGISDQSILLVSIASLWTLILTILSMVDRSLPFHPVLVLGVDAVIGLLMTGWVPVNNQPFIWFGLFPILTGAFYFGFQGGFFTAIAMILLEGIIITLQLGNAEALAVMTRPAIGMLLGGVLLGLISQMVMFFYRRKQSLALAEKEQAERAERERFKALYQITSTMTATLNYQKVLDMTLDMTADVLTEKGAQNLLVSALLLFSDDELFVGSGRRLTPSDHKVVLPAQEGVLAKCLRSGQPRVYVEPENDPELNRLIAIRNCQVVYCHPLRTLQDMFGVLVFGHPQAGFFNDQRKEIMEIIGRQALVALQNAELYQDLEQEKERMMEIQEEARKQLARDLHDGPTQSVAAIAMRVNFARRLIDRNVQTAGEELYKVEELARRTTKEIRHMLFTLRPLVLETGGLVAAFRSMADKTFETYDQQVVVEADEEAIEELEPSKQGVAFYIAEEAVNNARKHAEAKTIWVRLKKVQPEVVLLEVEDNGVGFNVGEVDLGYEKRGSLGMVNMRERTELVNGLFHLSSEVGKGTHIRVLIPVTEDAAERLKRGKL